MSDHPLLGYVYKPSKVPEGWSIPPLVVEICSVSNCMNSSLHEFVEQWAINEWGCFDSPVEAMGILEQGLEGYHHFAYRLVPHLIEAGFGTAQKTRSFSAQPLDFEFVSLGFDVTSQSLSDSFECSPLSCNLFAREVPVNEFCLISGLDEARKFAERCAGEQPEPGDYYIIEVLRKKNL